MNATYVIPADNRETVEKKLAEINKKAVKLGTTPISITFVRDHIETVRVPVNEEYPDGPKHEFQREWLAATVDGASAVVADYTFLATLRHTTDGNIISAVPGNDVPREYRNAPSSCDHCRTARRRSATYLVRHVDGSVKQVGKSCLIDFFGHDPHRMVAWAEALGAFNSWFGSLTDEDGERIARVEPTYTLADYLVKVAAVIRQDGWVSKGKAATTQDLTATASTAWRLQTLRVRTKWDREFEARYVPATEEDRETARLTLEWAEAKFAQDDDARNDYLHNLSVIYAGGLVNFRTAGLAASMIPAYRRDTAKATEAKTLAASGSTHVGAVGDRLRDLRVTVLGVIDMEPTMYGPRQLIKVQDDAGNLFVWFTGSAPDVKPEEVHYLTGTVKRHGTFAGVAQTELSRCALADAPKPTKKPKKEKVNG